MRATLRGRMLAVTTACIASLVLVATASAGGHRYIVVLKDGKTKAGLAAVAKAGGKVVQITPQIGVATVVARDGFGAKLRATGAVDGVALNAAWDQPELKPKLPPGGRAPGAARRGPSGSGSRSCRRRSCGGSPPPPTAIRRRSRRPTPRPAAASSS